MIEKKKKAMAYKMHGNESGYGKGMKQSMIGKESKMMGGQVPKMHGKESGYAKGQKPTLNGNRKEGIGDHFYKQNGHGDKGSGQQVTQAHTK